MKVPNIRFCLKFFDEKGEEITIRTLDDLRTNLNVTDLYSYLKEGTLSRWLRCLGLPDLGERIEAARREQSVRQQMRAVLQDLGVEVPIEDMNAVIQSLEYQHFRKEKVTSIDNTLGGVQLWGNGPFWAECNVGASKPEECGYYFGWGDTTGFTRVGWPCQGYSGWVSSMGTGMGNSPFNSLSSPMGGRIALIDATGNLMATHDAATSHCGELWRVPTSTELDALCTKCTTKWFVLNGVRGRLVTGKGPFSMNSIFLPAAGYGSVSDLIRIGSHGYYWSSTSSSAGFDTAWSINFDEYDFCRNFYRCYNGFSVRPLRRSPR